MGANRTIAVIGLGNMGGALVSGMLRAGVVKPQHILATDIDQDRLVKAHEDWGIRTSGDNRQAVGEADTILLAVKPQVIGSVIDELTGAIRASQVVISVAAGVATRSIESRLGEVPVVRVMPNTPALVGAGMSALCAGRYAGSEHLAAAVELLQCVGETVVVEEGLMDAVTGLSGSGPAYVFVLIDALADGGVKMGLPRPVALRLATQTVLGAARMVAETQQHPAVLRDKVASPAGATIAGLHKLEEKRFRDALISAVQAATLRSAELGEIG
jgi:pyrroline-5-carboxylate reductase